MRRKLLIHKDLRSIKLMIFFSFYPPLCSFKYKEAALNTSFKPIDSQLIIATKSSAIAIHNNDIKTISIIFFIISIISKPAKRM